MYNIRQPLIQGLLAYTATAGVFAIFLLDYSFLSYRGPLPYALSFLFPSMNIFHLGLVMTVISLVFCEGVFLFFNRPLQENLWMAFFCLSLMGVALEYLPSYYGFGIIKLNAFLVFSVYLIRFQHRLSSMGFLYQCLLALVFLLPSVNGLIDAGNDDRYGILDWKADEMTNGICVFLAPLFFILPGLFPSWKNRYLLLGCGLMIFLIIAALTNHSLVYFLLTGNAIYLREFRPFLSIGLIAIALSCVFCLYVLLLIGLGKLGYWLFEKIAARFSRYTTT